MRFCFHCWKFKEPVADLLSQRSDLLPIVLCWSDAKYLMGTFLWGIVQSTVTGGWSGSWEAAYAIKVFLTTMTRQPWARNIARLISITKHFSKQNKYTGNGGLVQARRGCQHALNKHLSGSWSAIKCVESTRWRRCRNPKVSSPLRRADPLSEFETKARRSRGSQK